MGQKSERNGEWIEVIEKEVRIQHDGKQLFVRIPTEISSYLNAKKGDLFKFIVELPESGKKVLGLFFEIRSKHGEEKDKKKAQKER